MFIHLLLHSLCLINEFKKYRNNKYLSKIKFNLELKMPIKFLSEDLTIMRFGINLISVVKIMLSE